MSYEKKRESKGIGPGCLNCVCCGPAPGPERTKWKRQQKRARKHEEKMKLREQLANMERNDD
ncbi:hypothetical protein DSS3PM1_00091 [Bacteriophage DSS3_PM1]|nr:hypothetical protein DSS3PM1_00091 [Bacteriophage DSS3_PM1]